MESPNNSEAGISNINCTPVKKRRYVISQHPLGSAESISNEENMSLKSVISEMRTLQLSMDAFNSRISEIENKLTCVLDKCLEIVDKVSKVENVIISDTSGGNDTASNGPECSLLSKNILFNNSHVTRLPRLNSGDTAPQHSLLNTRVNEPVSCGSESTSISPSSTSNTSRMITESSQIIKLNEESDHPDGSWLGNPQVAEARVRVPVRSYDLDHINISCSTAEKMALALLDKLFSRETLAESNLTGKGKHKKKQLNPLFIYGIYCHLQFIFNIQEPDWVRIKNNMEAKCRFLWKRKAKGVPLGTPQNLSKPNAHKQPEYSVELVSEPHYTTFPIYACDDDAVSRVVTVDSVESVYHLETGDLASEQLLSGTLGPVPVLVTSNSNIMLASAAATSSRGDTDTDHCD